MEKKRTLEEEPKEQPWRTGRARQVAAEYASDQREIIKKVRKPHN
jgi:hypothetical protein